MTKEPWEEYPHIWKTSASWFAYLRGCLRKAWMRHPAKMEYMKKHRKRIKNPNPRGKASTVWGFTCECCGKDFPQKDGQIDHKIPAGSLSKTEDIQGFVERLLYVSDESLQYVCKGCHAVITYSEKQGVSFEQAVIEKRTIELTKLPVKELQEVLAKHNKPSNNASVRKQSVRELVEEGKI